jgi:hypothetical protein
MFLLFLLIGFIRLLYVLLLTSVIYTVYNFESIFIRQTFYRASICSILGSGRLLLSNRLVVSFHLKVWIILH